MSSIGETYELIPEENENPVIWKKLEGKERDKDAKRITDEICLALLTIWIAEQGYRHVPPPVEAVAFRGGYTHSEVYFFTAQGVTYQSKPVTVHYLKIRDGDILRDMTLDELQKLYRRR